MNFPLMNKRNRQGMAIPDLAGGINLRDSVSMVNDNQLTDAVNVWFKDGALKTRPPIVTNTGHCLLFKNKDASTTTFLCDAQYVKNFPEVEVNIKGQKYTLSYVKSTNVSGESLTRIDFYLVGESIYELGYIEIGQVDGNCFVFPKKNIIY